MNTTRKRLPRTVKALAAVSLFTDASSEMIYPLLPAFLTATLGASAAWVGIIERAADATASLLKLASGWSWAAARLRRCCVRWWGWVGRLGRCSRFAWASEWGKGSGERRAMR